jgi:hypothetical protein
VDTKKIHSRIEDETSSINSYIGKRREDKMDVSIGWVTSPQNVRGLDPLGTQQPCILIYGKLLPGLTNVTDRISYYGFYPWFLWSWDQRHSKGDRSEKQFIQDLRRADCLLTLVALQHRVDSADDGQQDHHGTAMVGSDTLSVFVRDLGEEGVVHLSDHATLDEVPERYFQNKLGGLGQYYLGSLYRLGIVGERSQGGIFYNEDRGGLLAAAIDDELPVEEFWRVISDDVVNTADLRRLAGFCPCHLLVPSRERKIVRSVAFAHEEFDDEEMHARRFSLGLILDFARALGGNGTLNRTSFCTAAYTGHLPDGSVWHHQKAFGAVRTNWATYQRNEIYSLACQAVFWCGLCELWEADVVLPSAEAFGRWFSESDFATEALDKFAGEIEFPVSNATTFRHVLDGAPVPDMGSWGEDGHEIALTTENLRFFSINQVVTSTERAAILARALRALLALGRRSSEVAPYRELRISPDELSQYPMNLRTLNHDLTSTWPSMDLRTWVRHIATATVQTHIGVALRKLRQNGKDTFRIKPGDRGLEVTSDPVPPTQTNPRFAQALRALEDLGLLEKGGAGNTILTDDGTQELARASA